ncbi:tail fiber domain-containing protein [Alteromonas sp. RKMC-009]|nr:tail fiber domain-containing protein [Alteromonas sp. RKMC-009]
MFSQAIWDLIKPQPTSGSTGGSYGAAGVSDSQTLSQTILMENANLSTTTLSFKLRSWYTGSSPVDPVWKIIVFRKVRPKGGTWDTSIKIHEKIYTGNAIPSENYADILVNYVEDVDVSDGYYDGEIQFSISAHYQSGSFISERSRLESIVATQSVQGGGVNGDALTLNGQDPDYYLKWANVQNKPAYTTRWPTFSEVSDKPAQSTRWPTWSEVTSKPDVAIKPGDHTTNNTDYSMVWENNNGTLYTSAAHLKYNPANKRITTGGLTLGLGGVTNDLLTLDSAGHANIVIDRGSTDYDNNILFKTNGALSWRIWQGYGDEHLGIRHEASASEPMRIYEDHIRLQNKIAFRMSDGWLRINDQGGFGSGIYCGSSVLRTDGQLEVGGNGAYFMANGSEVTSNKPHRFNQDINAYKSVLFKTAGTGIYFQPDGSNDFGGIRYNSSGNDGNMEFWTSDDYSEPFIFRMYDTGSVGSGTNREVFRINDGNARVIRADGGEANLDLSSSTGTYARMYYRKSDNKFGFFLPSSASNYSTRLSWDGTNDRWTASGEVWADDNVATSDIRVKEDLKEIRSALDKVGHLTGYTYLQTKLKARKAGVIAQHVEGVLPEAVSKGEDDMLAVSQAGVVALLVNAVKELREEVRVLRGRVANG